MKGDGNCYFTFLWNHVDCLQGVTTKCDVTKHQKILKNFNTYDGIEEYQCSRAQQKSRNGSSEGSDVKIFWRDLYLQGFNSIIEDLNAKLSSEQYQLCIEIE